jgi:hypothetical protein
LARFSAPFALGVRIFIASATVGRHVEQIILPTPFTRTPPPQDEEESWMSSSQGSTPAEGRKQEEDLMLHIIYFSLTPNSSRLVSMCVGGNIMDKTISEAAQIL